MAEVKTPKSRTTLRRRASAVSAALAHDLRPDTLARLLEALQKQWKQYRKGLKKCQREVSEPAVHNSRVETRRLLAMLELLGPFLGLARLERARRTLKCHLDTFDDLRDTHVQLQTVSKLKRQFPIAAEWSDYLRKREKRFTRRTRKNIKQITTRRLGKLLDDWRAEIEHLYTDRSPKNINSMLLAGVQAAFARAAGLKTKIDADDTNTIHRTRVAFKRFRYMVETITQLVAGSHQRLLSAMHNYQTLMGVIQDAEVLLKSFDKFSRKRSAQTEAAAQLRAALLRRRQALVQAYLEHSDELFGFDPSPIGLSPGNSNGGRTATPSLDGQATPKASRPSRHP